MNGMVIQHPGMTSHYYCFVCYCWCCMYMKVRPSSITAHWSGGLLATILHFDAQLKLTGCVINISVQFNHHFIQGKLSACILFNSMPYIFSIIAGCLTRDVAFVPPTHSQVHHAHRELSSIQQSMLLHAGSRRQLWWCLTIAGWFCMYALTGVHHQVQVMYIHSAIGAQCDSLLYYLLYI